MIAFCIDRSRVFGPKKIWSHYIDDISFEINGSRCVHLSKHGISRSRSGKRASYKTMSFSHLYPAHSRIRTYGRHAHNTFVPFCVSLIEYFLHGQTTPITISTPTASAVHKQWWIHFHSLRGIKTSDRHRWFCCWWNSNGRRLQLVRENPLITFFFFFLFEFWIIRHHKYLV